MKWVSVDFMLPLAAQNEPFPWESDYVLIYTDENEYGLGRYHHVDEPWWEVDGRAFGRVTHWAELTAPT
jgi:hypothetical protein